MAARASERYGWTFAEAMETPLAVLVLLLRQPGDGRPRGEGITTGEMEFIEENC